jgi:ribulose-5-phosphate 4-epimerase/fuculose-1-phosphate aldolase
MALVYMKDSPTITAAEWQARVDLAAAHRLAVWHGFSEGIFNHLTLSVPGKSDRYYQIPFGLHWAEVTASCFMEVAFDGAVLAGEGDVEQSALCIHAPIHRLVPNHAAVHKVAYDHTYTGVALDPAEGERLAGILGPDKKVLFMANHGVVVCGTSVAEAYDMLYYLERAAQVQLYAMWTGRKLRHVAPNVVNHTLQQYQQTWPSYGDKPVCQHHFDALKRQLDRKEPDYAD